MTDKPQQSQLGRYKLLRLLGAGGMGEVYLAKAVGAGGFEKLVALKVLSQDATASEASISSLQREAMIGVHLDHDNVVQILDYGESDGQCYIAMEYVRGFGLSRVLEHVSDGGGAPLSPRTVVHILRTVLDALVYVHALLDAEGEPLDLIHGDVTPANVMLSVDGRIKLTDFGIAGLARELQGKGVVAGKPRYLPPDVLAGASQLQATDIYSTGVMLYECLLGAQVWKDLPPSALRDPDARTLPPLRQVRPDCPEALATVADRAVQPRLWERFTTAAELAAALDDALPRAVDDLEHHRSFVTSLLASESFVEVAGTLPSTATLGQVSDLPPHVTDEADITLAPPRKQRPLRFGMSPAMSSDRARTMGDRLCEYLTSRLNRQVHTTVLADYQTLADCLLRGEIDFAWTPPHTFVEIFERGGGMLAVMQRHGQITFEAALVVRVSSQIQSIDDLRGASAAWVDRRSTSGYLFPYAELLRRHGASAIGAQHFHGSHTASMEAVANGWAEFGATYATHGPDGAILSAGWLDLLGERAEEIRPVGFLGPIPGDNLSHSPRLSEPLAEQLTSILTRMHESEAGLTLLKEALAAERLVHADISLYEQVVSTMETIRTFS